MSISELVPPMTHRVVLPADLRLNTQRVETGEVVVKAVGDIDAATAPRLRELLESRAAGTPERLVVDLRDVGFLGAAGLSAIEQAYLRATGNGIACTVRVGSPHLLRVIRLLPLRFAEALRTD